MGNVEERVAYLEGRAVEHARSMDGIRDAIVHLEQRIDRRFESLEQRIDRVDARVTALDDKMTRGFMWLVGLNVATLAAVVTSFASVVSLLR